VSTRRRTRSKTTYNHARNPLRRNPFRHSSRLAPGDRLNRDPSSCALSSLGSAIRPTSDTLDGTRRQPAILGTRSGIIPFALRPRRASGRIRRRILRHEDMDTGEIARSPNARITLQPRRKRDAKLGFHHGRAAKFMSRSIPSELF